jgi:hypothetical protein
MAPGRPRLIPDHGEAHADVGEGLADGAALRVLATLAEVVRPVGVPLPAVRASVRGRAEAAQLAIWRLIV